MPPWTKPGVLVGLASFSVGRRSEDVFTNFPPCVGRGWGIPRTQSVMGRVPPAEAWGYGD